ncbi:MAG TPA: ubiquitin-like domain-containing protein [Microlunatus sp.]
MRKIIPVVAIGATALAVAGTTFAYAAMNNDVTLAVDGHTSEVATMSKTVGDVLAGQGITVGAHDVVAPSLDAAVVDGTKIAVQYGRQVTATVDGQPQTFWTTATSVDQALQSLQLDTAGADLSTSRSAGIGREGLNLTVNTAKTITIEAAGKDKKIETTALTVGQALTEAGIAVDSDDKVSTKESTKLKDGLEFSVTKVDVKTVTKTSKVGYDTVYKNTDSLAKGKTKVKTEGQNGKRTVVYTVVRHDGKTVKQSKKSSKITRKATDKVVLVGTKPAEVGSGSTSGNSVWDRLAQCESGGNWSINTGNGFYGGVQFSASTWRAIGGSGLPHQHSRETQIAMAKKLQARAGWGQWPGCSAKLGLR